MLDKREKSFSKSPFSVTTVLIWISQT